MCLCGWFVWVGVSVWLCVFVVVFVMGDGVLRHCVCSCGVWCVLILVCLCECWWCGAFGLLLRCVC